MKKLVLQVTLLSLVLLMVGSLVFAQGQKAAADDEITIVVMPKLVGIPYFNASETGALQAGKDLGVNVIYTGPSTADAAQQVRMIEDLIAKGVDAIAVAPNDPAALTPVLRKAKQAGILVLDWDTPADQSVVDLSVHQIDDQEYGQHIWDLLVEEMGDTGDYAIVTGGLSAANLNGWIDAGLSYAKTKYPKLNLVTDRVPTDEKQQIAYQKTLDLLKAYPTLKGIVGVSTPAPLGAAQAVQEKGVADKVAVVGTARSPISRMARFAWLPSGILPSSDTSPLYSPRRCSRARLPLMVRMFPMSVKSPSGKMARPSSWDPRQTSPRRMPVSSISNWI